MALNGTVLLCGNPNAGKSTLFNRLTGLRQHTGNWPGKTVGVAVGQCTVGKNTYQLIDLPGCYSLNSRSAEEELARDRILFGEADLCVAVCDATCIARGLVLALQILELTGRVILCVNLMDEARSKGISVNLDILSTMLGIPVCGISASNGQGVEELVRCIEEKPCGTRKPLPLPATVEKQMEELDAYLEGQPLPSAWLARTLTEGDGGICGALSQYLCLDPERDEELCKLIYESRANLAAAGYEPSSLGDLAAAAAEQRARELTLAAVQQKPCRGAGRDRRLDSVLAHPVCGVPAMMLLLAGVLWLTVRGANWPSEWLSRGLFALGELTRMGLVTIGVPAAVISALIDGVWRTAAWVVAVMLPPMAIFFPLFTILEDLGYLPRVAFHLDGAFARCGACGKQGLTMCMGLGCNAAGVTGCRIIDSRRERLVAVLTNAFVPCNGRFPMLIALTGFLFSGQSGWKTALVLTGILCFAGACTFLASALLGKTVLKGVPSSFALELPPYRKPKIGQILIRSLRDRTAYVLGRALIVAAPAGLVIWLLANVNSGAALQSLRGFMDPVGALLGMDGAILLAFILALPANEIVIPIILMIYTAGGCMIPYDGLSELWKVLEANGWTQLTLVCVIVFTLLHWPCGTTLLTVRRETGAWRWTALAAVLPTAFGVVICVLLQILT